MRFKRGKVWGLMCLDHKIMDNENKCEGEKSIKIQSSLNEIFLCLFLFFLYFPLNII